MTYYDLRIELTKRFDNEANMRSSREAIRDKAEAAGYTVNIRIYEVP